MILNFTRLNQKTDSSGDLKVNIMIWIKSFFIRGSGYTDLFRNTVCFCLDDLLNLYFSPFKPDLVVENDHTIE